MATPASVSVDLGLLLGDINGDGLVDNEDSHEAKIDRGQTTDSTTSAKMSTQTVGLIGAISPSSKRSSARCCPRELEPSFQGVNRRGTMTLCKTQEMVAPGQSSE